MSASVTMTVKTGRLIAIEERFIAGRAFTASLRR
jgi:hypothetical protein